MHMMNQDAQDESKPVVAEDSETRRSIVQEYLTGSPVTSEADNEAWDWYEARRVERENEQGESVIVETVAGDRADAAQDQDREHTAGNAADPALSVGVEAWTVAEDRGEERREASGNGNGKKGRDESVGVRAFRDEKGRLLPGHSFQPPSELKSRGHRRASLYMTALDTAVTPDDVVVVLESWKLAALKSWRAAKGLMEFKFNYEIGKPKQTIEMTKTTFELLAPSYGLMPDDHIVDVDTNDDGPDSG